MVNLRRLTDQAKKLVQKRGGTDALKEDADELKDIASGKGSLRDKAKAAGQAIKEPGAPGAPGEEEEKAAGEAIKEPGAPGEEEKKAPEQ